MYLHSQTILCTILDYMASSHCKKLNKLAVKQPHRVQKEALCYRRWQLLPHRLTKEKEVKVEDGDINDPDPV